MVHERKRLHLTIFTLFIINSLILSQGYSIKLKAPDFAGQQVILAEYFTSRMVPKDTVRLSMLGEGDFSGNKAFDGGLYIIYFNEKYYFDFLLDQDQFLSITTDSSDLIKNTIFEGSLDNQLFYTYKNYLAKKRIQQNKYMEELANAKSISDTTWIEKKMEDLNDEITAFVESMLGDNSHTFFATFLQAMKDVEIPEKLLKGTQKQIDSIRYVYFKEHYFDNFNLTDIRLLHTPLYDPKIKTYINKVIPQHPDSIIVAVDKLIELSRADDALFRYMLITLFNNYAESKIMGMDKVYFHIAEKYYIPDATWSTKEFIDKLKENLKKSKPTFIGNIAPDFELRGIPKDHFLMAEMDTAVKSDPHVGYTFRLSEIPAKYTILYFWEADCGHCQKATPILYDVFEKYKSQDVKVLAVHVINSVEGKRTWIDFVNEHEMYDWINCWSPYNNDFRNQYNLLSFPQLFILDRNKKIVAKGLAPEQADDFLKNTLNK